MRRVTTHHLTFTFTLGLALVSGACSDGPSAADLNKNPSPVTSGGSAGTGTAPSTGGSAGSSVVPSGGTGSTDATSGASSVGGGTDVGGNAPSGGSAADAGSAALAGSATEGGSGGSGGAAPTGPYADRSGSFKMLVLSRTAGFPHTESIATGKEMLKQIASEQGFELAWAESDAEVDAVIVADKLAQFEIIFHLNTTGDIFDNTQQQTYETWMKDGGAFAGTHSATDTENGWAFYSEVTGQYYNNHSNVGQGQIQFESSALDFPAVKGLPNPWPRTEEWYNFNSYQQWSVKPGFKILGRKAADQQPITWVREYDGFRSFYTAIGHEAAVFKDANVKKHITGGIMWAVRRDKLIK
jgi:uncharacterized protein